MTYRERDVPVYLCARFLSGTATLVQSVAVGWLPFLVPPERLPRSLALGSSVGQLAVITGPAVGGFLYALGAAADYGLCAVSFLLAGGAAAALSGRRRNGEPAALQGRLERVEGGDSLRALPPLRTVDRVAEVVPA